MATCKVDSCDRKAKCRGWCGMHHQRWYNHGDPLTTKMPTRGLPLKDRILGSITLAPSGCWEWSLMRDDDGYGTMRVAGRNVRAHRKAYEAFKGPIPEGHLIRHSCDNPPCVNPEHLLPGTQKDNSDDKFSRGRDRFADGEDHGHTTLTVKQVLAIRQLMSAGESSGVLAARFGVTRGTISNIALGRTWKNVGGPITRRRNIKEKEAA